MKPAFAIGEAVHTPLGKGIVRDVRNGGRLLVAVGARAVVMDAASVSPLPASPRRRARAAAGTEAAAQETTEQGRASVTGATIDLHGLTVPEALARVEGAVNEALLAGHERLRLVHGRSGGRIRHAVHAQLRAWPSVRAFRLDPANPGVTLVDL